MVLHYEAEESQLRDMDGEVKSAVPSWIKAWNKESTQLSLNCVSASWRTTPTDSFRLESVKM